MADITVTHESGDEYLVEVKEAGGSTRHAVRVDAVALERFGGGVTVEKLLEESFGFLLEREPKEAILRRFEVSVIGRYFPEYAGEIRWRLSRAE